MRKKVMLKVVAVPMLATSIMFTAAVSPLPIESNQVYAAEYNYQSQMDTYTSKLVTYYDDLFERMELMDEEEDYDAYVELYDETVQFSNAFINQNNNYAKTLNKDFQNINADVNKMIQLELDMLSALDQWYVDEIDDTAFEVALFDYLDKSIELNDVIIQKLTDYQTKYYVNYSTEFEEFLEHDFKDVTAPAPVGTVTYKVKKGDTLYKVAKNNGMTVTELKTLNNLKTDKLSVGQVLKVKATGTGTTPVQNANTYKVQKGDTLYKIAQKNNLSVAKLKSINNLKNDALSVGQVLKVKVIYQVQKGDTLYKISKANGVSVSKIKELNGLKSDSLSVGKVLVLN